MFMKQARTESFLKVEEENYPNISTSQLKKNYIYFFEPQI